jgi:hypothetical protein
MVCDILLDTKVPSSIRQNLGPNPKRRFHGGLIRNWSSWGSGGHHAPTQRRFTYRRLKGLLLLGEL